MVDGNIISVHFLGDSDFGVFMVVISLIGKGGDNMWILTAILGLIVGFIVGKFWKSRKISETVALAKEMAKNPSAIQDKAKEIVEIWK